LQAVRDAGISVCAGGIIGLGEGPQVRFYLALLVGVLQCCTAQAQKKKTLRLPSYAWEGPRISFILFLMCFCRSMIIALCFVPT